MHAKGTMVVGARCGDGVVLVADRRSLDPRIHELCMPASKLAIIDGFVLGMCGERAPQEKVCRLLEERFHTVQSLAQALDIAESTIEGVQDRYKDSLLEGPIVVALAGLEEVTKGTAKLYSVAAGYPPEEVDFQGWGIGGKYSEIARLFFSQKAPAQEVWKALVFLVVLVQKVNLAIGDGIDVVVVKHEQGACFVPPAEVALCVEAAERLATRLPSLVRRGLS